MFLFEALILIRANFFRINNIKYNIIIKIFLKISNVFYSVIV